MVNSSTHLRISVEFESWLKSRRAKTGLSSPQITRILAGKLNGMDVVELKQKRRTKKLTIRNVLKTPVGDIFNEFGL